MKNERDCKIVQDLLPNYIEKLTSEETNKFIDEHLEECNECKEILENMKKDLKVNAPKREQREVKYIKKYSKKLKIFKAILLIIVLLIVAIGINATRNNIILTEILEKEKVILSSKNIYYEINYADSERDSKFYKNGTIEMFDITSGKNRTVQWRNTTTNEGLILYPAGKVAYKTEASNMLGFNVPLIIHSAEEVENTKKYLMFSTIIYEEKIDNIDCYVILSASDSKTWVDKETGTVLRRKDGYSIKDGSNERIPMITNYTNWKINELSDQDVTKPDITGYEVHVKE